MRAKYYLMMVIAVGFFSIAAQKAITADDIAGRWKYLISDVPAEYESGFLTFEQKESKMTGFVEAADKQEMKNLTVDQGKVAFSTDSQAGEFKYTFVLKGDTLSGVVSSQYGDFNMKAVREGK